MKTCSFLSIYGLLLPAGVTFRCPFITFKWTYWPYFIDLSFIHCCHLYRLIKIQCCDNVMIYLFWKPNGIHFIVGRHKSAEQTIRLITFEYRCWRRSWDFHCTCKWIQLTLINLCCFQCIQTHIFIHWKLSITVRAKCYYSHTFSSSCFQKVFRRFPHI